MKKILLTSLFILLAFSGVKSQALIQSYNFPYFNSYNYFWGITVVNDSFWIASDFNGTGYPLSYMYKVTRQGVISDSFQTPFTFNHGLAWDGTGFWVAEDYRTSGGRLYKISRTGQRMDSIYTGTYAAGIGGIALDGNYLWFAVYSPDYTTYPNSYAYKVNLSTKQLVDTIPLRGRQVQGLAIKGDTILYVNDGFHGDPERIYAYRDAIGDTLFSFPVPDPDNDCDPHGMYWDGSHLYLIAYRIGNNVAAYRTLYKYSMTGESSPVIQTNPNTINFGNTIIGTTASQTLAISNTGSAKLIISGKNITSPRFGITPNNVPDTLQPGQSKNYTVTFNPNAFDTLSAQLQLQSNDGGTPTKIVTLKGKGVYSGAYINLSANSFDYQQRRTGSLCGYIFTVLNQGSSPLTINSMTFTTARYRIDTVGLTFPVTIDTQKTKSFRIWFNPNLAATYIDSLTISSNAVNLPSAKLNVTGTGQVVNSVLGAQMWQGNIPDNPYTSYDDPQPVSIKQIGDVNNDGVNDIIVSSGNYLTSCFNGNSSVTADILWSFNTGYDNNNTGNVVWKDGMQIRDDIDGDGIQDVVIGCGGGNEMVYTISGRTGKKIWGFGDSISYSDGDIEGIRVDKDFNGDGIKDVLASASGTGSNPPGRHAAICINGLTGEQIFISTQNSAFTGDIQTTPFGGAIGTNSNSGVYTVSGFNNLGSNVWSYTTAGKVWSLRLIPTINADTVKELLGLQGFSGGVFCIASNNGQTLWTKGLGSSNNGTIEMLDDLDSNGSPDFTLSGPQIISRVDSKTSNVLWSYAPGASYIRDVAAISDIDGDGWIDIVVGMQDPGKVFVMSGKTGVIRFTYEFGSGNNNHRADRVAALNSIDGNSTTEFVACERPGRIIMFNGGPNNPIGISQIGTSIPETYKLEQNYPNPFNPSTLIQFQVQSSKFIKIVVYDVLGKEVQTLVNEYKQPGTYEITFDAKNLSSGIYFYKMTAGNFTETKRMTLIK